MYALGFQSRKRSAGKVRTRVAFYGHIPRIDDDAEKRARSCGFRHLPGDVCNIFLWKVALSAYFLS